MAPPLRTIFSRLADSQEHPMNVTEHADAANAAASAGFKAAVTGGAMLSFGGWTSNDVAVLGGLVLGVFGLIVQIHFRRREYALRLKEHEMLRKEHERRMSELPDEAS